MARPRAFDEEQVLDAAMHAFRRTGFRDTSVVDLEAATGLRASSLYQAFGDKTGLFRRALEHYLAVLVTPRLDRFAGPDAGPDDLEQLFTSLFHPPYDDGYGCLLVNSAAEFGGSDAVPGDRVREGLDLVQRRFEDVVRRSAPGATRTQVRTEAARLVLAYHGVLLLSRAGRLGPAHRAAARAELDSLRALARGTAPTQEEPS